VQPDQVTKDDQSREPSATIYKAHAFDDEELASDLQGAGGLGMLGYRFHRKTIINW
jgi:hypothetical protein